MSRIFDSSHLTARKQERAIAGSFLTQVSTAPGSATTYMRGSQPMLGIKDNSIMSYVKTGGMTQYTRFPTCIGISAGCPCPELAQSLSTPPYVPAIPGQVSGIVFTIGSIIISWNAPSTSSGPFTYRVTPYLNGVALESVYTTQTNYRFSNLQDWKPYSFTVCAMNANGEGPEVLSPYFLAPPENLSRIMTVTDDQLDPVSSLQYILNAGLNSALQHVANANLGPTRGSRYMYIFICSLVGAWNWICSDSRITGIHDNWNWDNKAATPLSDNDSVIWMMSVMDALLPRFISGTYRSIYQCPSEDIDRVKEAGEWDTWFAAWQSWYSYRGDDRSGAAATNQMPTDSVNWNKTIIVDGTTVSEITNSKWTRLTVQNKKQGYLTHNWNNVLSTCLTEANELQIQNNEYIQPITGEERDAEIDDVKNITAQLNDRQKVIAEFWAGGPGTVAPSQMCVWLWKIYACSLPTISVGTLMFSMLDLAIHMFEGCRVTWRLKALHMEARPIQEIRRRYNGQTISSWNGVIDGSQWVPYQTADFVTPPFADFPSGHSHFSKAFALTMNKWFGETIDKNTVYYDKQTLFSPLFSSNQTTYYGDFMVQPGTSTVEPGVAPANIVSLSFNTWDEMANSAGMSRLYGGIHAMSAHTNSQAVAILVDGYINSTWNISEGPIMRSIEPMWTVSEVVEDDTEYQTVVEVAGIIDSDDETTEPVVPVEEPVVPVEEPVVPVVPVEEPVVPVEEPVVE